MEGARSERKPGDSILDRYLPNASLAEREAARANLNGFAAVLLRACKRMANEQKAIRAENESAVELEE